MGYVIHTMSRSGSASTLFRSIEPQPVVPWKAPMTATATAEIAHLDFEAAASSREVGELQLADWDCSPLEGVLSLGNAREGQYVVVVLAAWGEERAAKRTLTLPRAALVAAGCDANIPSCLVLEHDR